jgi:hypothetical protein
MYDFSQKLFVDEFPMFLNADATILQPTKTYRALPTYPLALALSDPPPEITPESTTLSPVLRC